MISVCAMGNSHMKYGPHLAACLLHHALGMQISQESSNRGERHLVCRHWVHQCTDRGFSKTRGIIGSCWSPLLLLCSSGLLCRMWILYYITCLCPKVGNVRQLLCPAIGFAGYTLIYTHCWHSWQLNPAIYNGGDGLILYD